MKTLREVVDILKGYDGEKLKIMEVCGTHTSSIFKSGIKSLISPKLELISGPGCPVCVTHAGFIDRLVELSLKEKHCVLTFGDMMKVKGTKLSLTEAGALGARVQILYSPLEAIKIAMENRDTEYVFAAVGFETTTPIYAILIDEIIKNNVSNLKLLTSLKTIIPALSFICENEENIDAFLCPGHVSVITGSGVYRDLSQRYKKPFVVAGFEGEHILAAIFEILRQIKAKDYSVKNLYTNAVSEEGNKKAQVLTNKYFEPCDDYWRGIGIIHNSALRLREAYTRYDVGINSTGYEETEIKGCRCRDVILGRIHPTDCVLFGKQCSPLNAVGPCMVSTEGVCGIWYKNRGAL